MIDTRYRHSIAAKIRLSHAIVLATLTKAMTMKSNFEKLVLLFGLLLVLGCGARSPLDTPNDESPIATGGIGGNLGSGGYGGVIGSGGRPNSGGTIGSGGRPGAGGAPNVGGSGGMGPGGSPAGGSKGGAAGSGLGGQVGGNNGGSGGSGLGGQVGGSKGGAGGSGLGGQVGGAGGTVVGGRGGAGGSAGGAAGSGAGGGVVCSPTTPCDSGAGGDSGLGGRDSGADAQDVGRDGVAGAGGSIATGGSSGTGGNTCPGLASNEELIDDLNDGDRFIPSLNGRAGAWTDSHDSSPNGKMYPDPNTGFSPTDSGDVCRKFAAYVTGTGYVLWGADFWFGLGSPYNASKYKGFSFWARIDAGTSSGLRVAFPDKDTQPDGNNCQTSVSSGPTACFDHYGYRFTLNSTWTKYTVTFGQLAQDGWGHPGTAFDPASLYEVLFQIPVNATFGVWIDNVAFTM